MNSQFGERTFEFCYNSEFVQKYRAILATYPYIPTLRAEKYLGYDVRMLIRKGKYTRSLFLQYKVSSFAQNLTGSNRKYYQCYKGPYYKCGIDTDQHNSLYDLSKYFGLTYYCVPLFYTRIQLDACFRGMSIMNSATWFSPSQMGEITDGRQDHKMTYEPKGLYGYFHSDPKRIEGHKDLDLTLHDSNRMEFLDNNIVKISMVIDGILKRRGLWELLPREYPTSDPVRKIQYAIGNILGFAWLLLP